MFMNPRNLNLHIICKKKIQKGGQNGGRFQNDRRLKLSITDYYLKFHGFDRFVYFCVPNYMFIDTWNLNMYTIC